MRRGFALPVVCPQSEPPSGWKISTKTKTCVACRSVAAVCPHCLRARSPNDTARIPTPQSPAVTQQRVRRQAALASLPTTWAHADGNERAGGGRVTTQCPYCLDEMCDVTSLCQHVECHHPYEYKVSGLVMRAGVGERSSFPRPSAADTARRQYESIRFIGGGGGSTSVVAGAAQCQAVVMKDGCRSTASSASRVGEWRQGAARHAKVFKRERVLRETRERSGRW
jgi:hypothetical protein